jgi:hypothetical protein
VQHNLRNYIWQKELGDFVHEAQYFKSFGSYESLFTQCPRLHFNGYYVCREKYVRIGEKNEKYPVAPIHVVYYYRYFRFLPDGTALYNVRSKRIKSNEMLTFLSKGLAEGGENPETMVGEYIQHMDRLFVKAVRNNTVFTYVMQIRTGAFMQGRRRAGSATSSKFTATYSNWWTTTRISGRCSMWPSPTTRRRSSSTATAQPSRRRTALSSGPPAFDDLIHSAAQSTIPNDDAGITGP